MKKFAKIAALALVVVMSLAMLVACAPNSNPDKALEALKKNGYTAVKTGALLDGASSKVSGFKVSSGDDGTKGDYVVIYYFESSAKAKDSCDKVKSYFEDDQKKYDNMVIEQSGAMIYYGTKDGINAAR